MTNTLRAVGGAASKKERAESNILGVVRMIKAARNVQADELAVLLGISRASVYERLKGKSAFTAGEVAVMAGHFGVPLDVLYSGPDALLGRVGSQEEGTIGSWFPTFGDVPLLSERAA
jgi:transcriptional regulator with XRE-family HTH domain